MKINKQIEKATAIGSAIQCFFLIRAYFVNGNSFAHVWFDR